MSEDLAAYPAQVQLDTVWLSRLKQLLRRAAQGTVRGEEWEYPCATSRGLIGELKMVHTHEHEVDGDSDAGAKQQAAIDDACSRTMFTDLLGRGLEDWNVT